MRGHLINFSNNIEFHCLSDDASRLDTWLHWFVRSDPWLVGRLKETKPATTFAVFVIVFGSCGWVGGRPETFLEPAINNSTTVRDRPYINVSGDNRNPLAGYRIGPFSTHQLPITQSWGLEKSPFQNTCNQTKTFSIVLRMLTLSCLRCIMRQADSSRHADHQRHLSSLFLCRNL